MKLDTDALIDGLEENVDALTEEAAMAWYNDAQQTLRDADGNLGPIVEAAEPPVWDDSKQRWVFSWPHVAATFWEYGTDAHTIRAREAEVLAFEWPDAPAEIREQFRETYPTVFFKKVDVEGLPELRFVRGGREVARKVMASE